MDVSVAEAKERVPDLIRAVVENGDSVIITSDGKAVAQIVTSARLNGVRSR